MRLDFEKFLNENGLKVGDEIKLSNGNICKIEIDVISNFLFLENAETKMIRSIEQLQFDFEKVEPKKKVGDLICKNVECDECPLYCIRCLYNYNNVNDTLRERFEATLKKYPQLETMRECLEEELNKEVEE